MNKFLKMAIGRCEYQNPLNQVARESKAIVKSPSRSETQEQMQFNLDLEKKFFDPAKFSGEVIIAGFSLHTS